ncbi:MAG: sigma 54-interacting transcriptional regulator [Deltaproteobacteria bacterium]|jgi:DNA-binding NtrC family response regulator|nr:sigma 54-interacting transcriptional regulator [Deltaproteobacteria bacterium]
MAELVAFREDRLGFRFPISQNALLGRASNCDLILFDRSASRRHAEITKSDDNYFIEDLNSTNGTLVNDQPISERLQLKPFDCIKIGQEIYIFEPHLDVITGPAPAALIVNVVNESQQNLVTVPAQDAAQVLTSQQAGLIAALNYSLCQATPEEVCRTVVQFLEKNLGATAVSIIWPGGAGNLGQTSFYSFPEDKRLLLSQVPFRLVTEMGQGLVWPHIINELFFNSGNRHIEVINQPCLLAPLYDGTNTPLGLIYLENANETLTEKDLNFLASLAQMISPFIKHSFVESHREEGPSRTDNTVEAISNLMTRDNQIKVIFSTAAQLAQGGRPIFLTGEVGTGKTNLAKHIHTQSGKRNGRFMDLTLYGLTQSQIELALFGQEGGPENTLGIIALADNGTIFLRHIEYLPLNTQRTLLMAIEQGLLFPLGARHSRTISVRFVTSSSANLTKMVENGTFREDLYCRLTAINLALPPLRDTKNDIEGLATQFIAKAAKFLGVPFHSLDNSVVECLRAYPWPGNITELKSECQKMAQFSRNGHVVLDSLPIYLRLAPDAFSHGQLITGDTLLGEAERCFISKTLATHNGDIEKVGQVLSLNPEDVIKKCRSFGLEPMDFQPDNSQFHFMTPSGTSIPSEEE